MAKTSGSIRTHILVWNMATLACILVLLGFVVRQVTVRAVYHSVEAEMMHRVGPLLDGHLESPGPPPGPPEDRRDGRVVPRQHRYDLKGECVQGEEDQECIPWDSAAFKTAANGRPVFTDVTVEGQPFHVLTSMYPLRGTPIGFVQVPYPTFDVDRSLKIVDSSLILLAPLALLISALGGWLMAGRMLKPVRAMASAAARIGGSNLGDRLPVQGSDEFAQLGGTVNAMLGRLQQSALQQEKLIEQQRRFTADASHELKTPLTTIKANAQLALAQDDGVGYRLSMVEVSRAAAEMDQLVQDLLLLARSDSGLMGRSRIELLLSEVLERAVSRTSRPGFAAVQVTLDDESLTIEGNENELVRLFSNLLENARRFSPADQQVLVRGGERAGRTIVQIIDHGPGVSDAHLPFLGDRFYREDTARARTDGGSGLGLSICKEIVEAHGGTLTFEKSQGTGLTVTVTL